MPPSTPSTTSGASRLVRLAAVVLVLATAACGADDDSDEPASGESTTTIETSADSSTGETTATTGEATESTAPAATTGQEPGSVEDAVVAAYIGFWDARFEANSPPDPDAPALAEHATGQALEDVRAEANTNRDAGVEFRQADDPANFRRVDVVEVTGDTATVQECVVDDTVVVGDDGSVVNDVVATQSLRGDLRLVDGRWRLAQSTLLQRWEGVRGCALADE